MDRRRRPLRAARPAPLLAAPRGRARRAARAVPRPALSGVGAAQRPSRPDGAVRLLAVGTGARELWRVALSHDAGAGATQTPEWLDALCDLGRHEDATRAYRTDDERCVVLPLARRRGAPGPLGLEGSLPFGWSAGGLVGSTPGTAYADVAGVIADLVAQPALRTEVQPVAAASPAWEAAAPPGVTRLPIMSQVVDLSGGVDRVWSSFSASARRNARRAERMGIEVRSD